MVLCKCTNAMGAFLRVREYSFLAETGDVLCPPVHPSPDLVSAQSSPRFARLRKSRSTKSGLGCTGGHKTSYLQLCMNDAHPSTGLRSLLGCKGGRRCRSH